MIWRQIADVDARIHSIDVTWDYHTVSEGSARFDVDKYVEEQLAIAKIRRDQVDLGRLKKGLLTVGNALHSGFTCHATHRVTSDGKTTRGEVLADILGEPGQKAHYVDIYDGTNVIQLNGVGASLPQYGRLVRDSSQTLKYVAPGPYRRIYVFAAPITGEFRPDNTSIVVQTDAIVLVHTLPLEPATVCRLYLSRETLRPIRLVTENPVNGRVHTTVTIEGYREYNDGILFPGKITDSATDERGDLLYTNCYTLKSVRFNADVDRTVLTKMIPSGTLLTDCRFGEKESLTYKLMHTLPSDQMVLHEIEREQARLKAGQRVIFAGSAVSVLACALVCGGCIFLYRRLHRSRTTARAEEHAVTPEDAALL